jgi:hypothetical protein
LLLDVKNNPQTVVLPQSLTVCYKKYCGCLPGHVIEVSLEAEEGNVLLGSEIGCPIKKQAAINQIEAC